LVAATLLVANAMFASAKAHRKYAGFFIAYRLGVRKRITLISAADNKMVHILEGAAVCPRSQPK
jgi:hypothetical protein